MSRPRIGVTGPDRGGFVAWIFTRLAIAIAGGRAVRVTPSRASVRDISMDAFDGLVLGGGADVSPERYSKHTVARAIKETEKDVRKKRARWLSLVIAPFVLLLRKLLALSRRNVFAAPDAARDELELALLSRAIELGRPVLGICRGAQLLNVHCGGTLFQDLAGFYVETPQVFSVLPRKNVSVVERTRLAEAIGAGRCRVNALHRQAVRDLGGSLRVAACEANGVVQAIEHVALPLVVGVQWHPEYIPQHRRQRALFSALVNESKSRPR